MGTCPSLVSNRPPFSSPGALDSGPGKASDEFQMFSAVCRGAVRPGVGGSGGRLGGLHAALLRSAGHAASGVMGGPGPAQQWPHCLLFQDSEQLHGAAEDQPGAGGQAVPHGEGRRPLPHGPTPHPHPWFLSSGPMGGGTAGLAVISLPLLELSHRPYFLTPGTGPVPPFLH